MMKIRKILQATLSCLLVLLLSASFVVPPAMAAGITTLMPAQTFENPTPTGNNYFGSSVAIDIDGDNLVIGEYYAGGINYKYIVYLFKASTGELLQTFSDPNPSQYSYFAKSVAVDGDSVVITGGNFYEGKTLAYLFKASTGELLQTFSSNITGVYGSSVAIDGDAVLVGSSYEGETRAGKAYLFKASTGELLETFSPPNPILNAGFGDSVAIDGDSLLIGAPGLGNSNYLGEAYLFDASTGELRQTFSLPLFANGQNDYYFGGSVAIDGDSVLIGNGIGGSSHGAGAYLFKASTGELLQILSLPYQSYFGGSVAIDGDNLVIGTGETATNGAYLFKAGTSEVPQDFSVPEGKRSLYFGYSVAMDGDTVVIGDPFIDYIGEVYLYNIDNSSSSDSSTDKPTPTIVVNIDAQKNNQDNPVVESLKPGTYKTHLIGTSEGGKFDAWNSISSEIGCDANGENCKNGWESRYYFKSPYNKVIDSSCSNPKYGSCRYLTAAKAAAKYPEDVEFTISKETDVKFYIYDTYDLKDNQGGISLEIIKQ